MKKFFVSLFIAIFFFSCSEYQKVYRSEDIGKKYTLGEELFEKGKYGKANKLFEQIVPQYRGKPQAEKLMYLYSMTFYKMKDYYLSAHHFERFENSYPKSEKAEESLFLSAKSYYMLSPVYSKEQKETYEALEKLQLFINKYPDSEYLAEANTLIKELDYKLEKKAFEIAKQYNTISDYEASIKSMDNLILEFPGTSFREEALFYRLDSAYKLAINSVESKKGERINTALGYLKSFKKSYSNSEFMDEVNDMESNLNQQLQQYNTKS